MSIRVWLGAVAVVLGCSSPKPGEFPTRSELTDIAERPVPPNTFPKLAPGAEAWTLADPLPEALEVREYAGNEPVDAALRDLAAQRPGLVIASTALHCVAVEMARYLGDQGAAPPASVQRFVAGRCGATRTAYTVATLTLPVGPADDATSMQRLTAEAPATLRKAVGTGAEVAGIALVRGTRKVALAAVAQPRNVDIAPVPLVPVDGKVTLRGQALFPANVVSGYVTRGAFGYGECAQNEGVRRPAFELTCEVAPGDDFAWIEVIAVPPGRILGHIVLEALVFPKGATTATFAPPPHDASVGIPTTHAIVDALNARRAQAGLGPVRLDLPESGTVSKLAPHYFAAARGQIDEIIADKVVLGVKAGWDVDGIVREGDGAALVVEGARGPDAIVDRVLESPVQRAALFDPEVQRVAVGLVADPASQSLGVLFGSYALVDPAHHVADAVRFFARLSKLRTARGLPPPIYDRALEPTLVKAATTFQRGDASADDALKAALESSVNIARVAVRGIVLQAGSIDRMPIPKALLTVPEVHVSLAVGHHKAEDSPWTSLAVFLVVEGRNGAPPAL